MRERHRGVSVLVVAHESQRRQRLAQHLDAYDVALVSRHLPDATAETVLEGFRASVSGCRVALVSDRPPADDVVDRGFDAAVVEPTTTASLTRVIDRLVARTDYESNLDSLYELCVQRANSRTDGGQSSSDDDDDASSTAVDRIDARIREIRETMDESMATFETTDYRASFRDLRTK